MVLQNEGQFSALIRNVMQGNLHYTCHRSCIFPLRNVCVVTSKDLWYPHHELVLRCALTDPVSTIRKWCHSRHSNKLVRIRYDSETEPGGHFLMSVRPLHNLSTDMNSSLQMSETGHIVRTATFYLIFLEVYVKCVFFTSNKAAGEVGNRIVTLR
jgi:hypothetical protein